MPRKVERALTARFCQTAAIGMYCDGEGLYLQVTLRKHGEGVNRSWIYRYRSAGRLRDMGLGSFPTVGLSDARERARQARLKRFDGIDPLTAKREAQLAAAIATAKNMTFRECAEGFIENHRSGWKSPKHAGQWLSTLQTYAYPVIGNIPVAAVTDAHIVKVLQPIWQTKTETANRVRGRIEKILDRAKVLKLRSGENPAKWSGHLDQILPSRSQVAPVEHHKALPYADLPRFMVELRRRDSLSARALEFTILTAARTGDTIGAKRTEVDREQGAWTIPAGRLKGKKGARKRDHIVPLCQRAIEILNKLPRHTEYLFAHDDGRPLSNMAMLELLQGMGFGEDLTTHGFRSAFKDWAAEQTAYPNELSEMALAHTVSDKVEAAYRRGDMREKRRRLMDDWSTFANRPPSSAPKIVPIRPAIAD